MKKYAMLFLAVMPVFAQLGPAPAKPKPPRNAKEGAPVDFTGYWVSVVTEDWRWRMVTPIKGDFASIPLTPAGRAAGNAWDPARDEAAGEQCRSYGAPAVMRIPGGSILPGPTTILSRSIPIRARRLGCRTSAARHQRATKLQGYSFAQGNHRCADHRRSRAGPPVKERGDDRSK